MLALAGLQFYPFVESNWNLFFILYTGPSLAAPLAQFIRYRRVSDAVRRGLAYLHSGSFHGSLTD